MAEEQGAQQLCNKIFSVIYISAIQRSLFLRCLIDGSSPVMGLGASTSVRRLVSVMASFGRNLEAQK